MRFPSKNTIPNRINPSPTENKALQSNPHSHKKQVQPDLLALCSTRQQQWSDLNFGSHSGSVTTRLSQIIYIIYDEQQSKQCV
ncbi:hypothetical protein L596_021051 [Steinernema carpocapsae]|uniref:Uncharacterized protein n=1 Tax=Steinernema carpocapsae TaxID=34508 RepID=A0A4U5MVC2_STECR|nr:hypothetical protein L596_021051 [Steinernema carpocapsae]